MNFMPDDSAFHGDGSPRRKWAVCCSGGGIRSAAFCLGGLQSLRDQHILRPEDSTLFAVSGGSYIAGAWVARETEHRRAAPQPTRQEGGAEPEPNNPTRPNPPDKPGEPTEPYRLRSEEECRLRNNTHYLAPDLKTRISAVLSLLYGAVLVSVMLLAPVLVVSYGCGLALRGAGILTSPGQGRGRGGALDGGALEVSLGLWWWVPATAAVVATAVFIGWRMCYSFSRPECASVAREQWTTVLGVTVAVALLTGFLVLVLPFLVVWLAGVAASGRTLVDGPGWHLAPAPVLAAISALVPLAGTGITSSHPRGERPLTSGTMLGLLGGPAGWVRRAIVPWLALALVILFTLFIAVAWVGDSVTSDPANSIRFIVIGCVLPFATRFLFDLSRLSMHDFYRWRLADGYGRFPEPPPHLSELGGRTGLVITAIANITARRERPPGLAACSLTFAPDKVTLWQPEEFGASRTGAGPGSGGPEVSAGMRDMELMAGRRHLTLFDVIAISGAAVSPLMGRETRRAFRLPMAIANARLGVWLPHPAVVRDARRALTDPSVPHPRDWPVRLWLALWLRYLIPRPGWKRAARVIGTEPDSPEAKAKYKKCEKRHDKLTRLEARLWAGLLHLRELAEPAAGTSSAPPWRRCRNDLLACLLYRALQPKLGLLWAEAAGRLSYRATWLYATDGGHYDNLGLVSAVQSGANDIVVLDASGDHPHTWSTIGRSQALARVDAGCEIELNPSTMRPDGARVHGRELAEHEVLRPWAAGWCSAPATATGTGTGTGTKLRNRIWVCKLGWWDDTTWDIRAFAAANARYPSAGTARQLYDADEFEAYRALGYQAVADAVAHGGLRYEPPPTPFQPKPSRHQHLATATPQG